MRGKKTRVAFRMDVTEGVTDQTPVVLPPVSPDTTITIANQLCEHLTMEEWYFVLNQYRGLLVKNKKECGPIFEGKP